METTPKLKPSGFDLLAEFGIKPMPLLRLANKLDIPTVWCIADDYKESFLEDGESIEKQLLFDLVANCDLVVCVDTPDGLPWGFFYIAEANDLARHGTIHFLCRPHRLKDVMKYDLIGQFIDKAFIMYNIDKIKGRAISTQSTAQKLLARNRFFKVGTLLNETVVQKKRVNVVLFELQKHYWQKMRRDTNGGITRPTDGRHEVRGARRGTSNDGGRRRGRYRGPSDRHRPDAAHEGHEPATTAEAAGAGAPSVVQRSAPVDAGIASPATSAVPIALECIAEL